MYSADETPARKERTRARTRRCVYYAAVWEGEKEENEENERGREKRALEAIGRAVYTSNFFLNDVFVVACNFLSVPIKGKMSKCHDIEYFVICIVYLTRGVFSFSG